MPADTKNIGRCKHCELPAWNGTEKDGHIFCCYGCQMAHQLHIDSPGSSLPVPENLLIRWVTAFAASMLLIFLSLTIHFDPSVPSFFPVFSLLLATSVFALLSKELLINLKNEWQNKQLSLGTLIFVGVAASYLLSVVNWIKGNTHIYFETSAMILTFYVGSLLIDIYLKKKISDFTGNWNTSVPDVIVQQSNGRFKRIKAVGIRPGTLLKTEQNIPVPVDGILQSKKGYFQEDQLTGEPKPVLKTAGDEIHAGSVSMDENLQIEASSTYNTSNLQQYYRKHDLSKNEISSFELIAHRAARMLLYIVISLATAVFIFYSFTASVSVAVNHTLSVLLIGCPCAFAIATPAALWIVQNKFYEAGALLRTGTHALEQLARVDHIVFDKTGTLTEQARIKNMRIVGNHYSKNTLTGILGSLEATQQHPIAEAIRKLSRAADTVHVEVTDITPIPGLGLQGEWTDQNEIVHRVQLLNSAHTKAQALADNRFGLFISGELKMTFSVDYPLKQAAEKTLDRLVEQGYTVSVLSGDPAPQKKLIDKGWEYIGGLSPDQKQEHIQKMKDGNERICFVGDGINDLLAMTEADVSIAMFSGSNKNKTTADLILFNPTFEIIKQLFGASQRAKNIIYSNFFWASIYNLTGLTLAAMGYLNPLLSILAMILSSAFVTGNSLRLRNLSLDAS